MDNKISSRQFSHQSKLIDSFDDLIDWITSSRNIHFISKFKNGSEIEL